MLIMTQLTLVAYCQEGWNAPPSLRFISILLIWMLLPPMKTTICPSEGHLLANFPAGNIIHQYADDLSLEEADMYERRLEKMQKGKIASTKLKTAPPPLNKGRAGIDQAAFLLRYFVEVAEYLSAGIPGQNCYD